MEAAAHTFHHHLETSNSKEISGNNLVLDNSKHHLPNMEHHNKEVKAVADLEEALEEAMEVVSVADQLKVNKF